MRERSAAVVAVVPDVDGIPVGGRNFRRARWLRHREAGAGAASDRPQLDQLVGVAHIIFHRSTTLLDDTCYLQDLFTAPAMRGKGVGRQLIEAVYARARDAGANRVYWQTHETNATAMRLYDQVAERSGFVVYRKLL